MALISPPFAVLSSPSIQIGLLKAIIAQYGFPVASFHLYLDFARAISTSDYSVIADDCTLCLGEWLFSVEAFGDEAPDPTGRLLAEALLARQDFVHRRLLSYERLCVIRRTLVPAFLDRAIDAVDWTTFRAVGFSSTFQQTAAAIALARRIKSVNNHAAFILGGANAEGEMGSELARSSQVFDFVVSGEADTVLPVLLMDLARRGVSSSNSHAEAKPEVIRCASESSVVTLDALPIPDYTEYFERAESLGLLPGGTKASVEIPFESSRGCWWGAKHHCTFCGLNGQMMRYRSKSCERVLQELNELSNTYGSFRFNAVDNIFDHHYHTSLVSRLLHEEVDYDIFYEMKANMSRKELKTLRSAGIRRIQPGIESLSSRVLTLMNKGTTGLNNINVLRWAQYYKLEVTWNFLWGFPGEARGDYEEQERILPFLRHLPPPVSWGKVWLERFSPLFARRCHTERRAPSPVAGYHLAFPERFSLGDLAYFFEYDLEGALPDETYGRIGDLLEGWSHAWTAARQPSLVFRRSTDCLEVEDFRDSTPRGRYRLFEPLKGIYQSCVDGPRTFEGLRSDIWSQLSDGEVISVLRYFCELGLMINENEQYLSLAIPATDRP